MFSKLKYLLVPIALFNILLEARDGYPDKPYIGEQKVTQYDQVIVGSRVHVLVVGQGVAPSFARSPAQAFVLAKRAATADAYRLIAEKLKGVKIEGKDTIENMSIKSSVIRSKVSAMIRNAQIVKTTFKDGLCEVEMELGVDTNSF